MRELPAGTIVDDRYQIVARLGSGGMADVYCAEDTQLGRRVALKILYGRFAADDEFVERFRREASHAAGLQHQHVVSVYDRGEWDSTSYIAMEFVDGQTLKQIVQSEAPLDPLRAIDLIIQVLRAVRFAHRHGVIHRDLKPHNVMVDMEGRAKVTDFGIARAGASDMTQTGSIMGTAQYLSPEQAQGLAVSEPSDLYSVGIVLYELLTGHVPFEGESPVAIALKQVNASPTPPSQLNPEIPAPLESAILRALAKAPADRFADADAFIAALEDARLQILGGAAPASQVTASFDAPRPAPAPADPLWGTMPDHPLEDEPPQQRARWPWFAAAGAIVLAAIVVIALLVAGGKKVEVPNLVGKQYAAAAARLHNDGLEVTQQQTVSDRDQNEVVSQDPRPGTQVKKGETVALTVSNGGGPLQVPIVSDLGRAAARKQLVRAGFKVGADRTQSSDTVTKNHVISTIPSEGNQLNKGATVYLVVSTGPEQVPVPTVTGQTVDDATAALREAGFKVTTVGKKTDEQDPGTVLEQSPASGTAPDGSTVTLTVARAPDTVAVPDVTGESSTDAVTALITAGLTPKSVDQEVPTADGDDTVITQSPTGSTTKKVKRGTEVTITVGRFTGATTTPGATTPAAP